MGEETSVRSPRKTSLGHLRAVKQLITVALDLKMWRVDPEAFHPSYKLSQQQQFKKPPFLYGGREFKTIRAN